MHALNFQLDYVTVAVNNLLEEWELTVYTQRNVSCRVLVDFLKSLSVTELWPIRNKVKRNSNLNELLRDKLMDCADHNSPQVVRNPYCVKFINESRFETFYLDAESLEKYHVRYMIPVSTLLRTKGFASKVKSDADDVTVGTMGSWPCVL